MAWYESQGHGPTNVVKGTITPSSDFGVNGGIYLKYVEVVSDLEKITNVDQDDAFIKIGTQGSKSVKFVIKCNIHGGNRWATPIGSRYSVNNSNELIFLKNNGSISNSLYAMNGSETSLGDLTNYLDKNLTITLSNELVKVDDGAGNYIERIPSNTSEFVSPEMTIFNLGIEGSIYGGDTACFMDLYECKVYQNNILDKYLLPATQENTIGLIDVLDGTFYASSGTLSSTARSTPLVTNTITNVYTKANGEWQELVGADIDNVLNLNLSDVNIYKGMGTPSNNIGNNGQIFLQYTEYEYESYMNGTMVVRKSKDDSNDIKLFIVGLEKTTAGVEITDATLLSYLSYIPDGYLIGSGAYTSADSQTSDSKMNILNNSSTFSFNTYTSDWTAYKSGTFWGYIDLKMEPVRSYGQPVVPDNPNTPLEQISRVVVGQYYKENGVWQNLNGTNADLIQGDDIGWQVANILKGTTVPTSYEGEDGQIYLQYGDFTDTYDLYDYLEVGSTQGAYINTQVSCTEDAFFEVEFNFTGSHSESRVFGCGTGGGAMFLIQNYNFDYMSAGESSASNVYQIPDAENRHKYKANADGIYVDDVLVDTNVHWNSALPQRHYNLFAIDWDGTAYYAYNTRVYHCKIWNGSRLVRYFIPARRKSDGENGMLDIVNGVFYDNDGSQSFTVGGPISETPEIVIASYQKVEGEWQTLTGSDANNVKHTKATVSREVSYLKWQITKTRTSPAGGSLQMSEFYIYQNTVKYTWNANATVTSDMEGNTDEGPENLIDGNRQTKYCTADWGIYQNNECNIIFSLGETITLDCKTGYGFATANDESSRDPVSWTLYGSRDGIDWEILDSKSDADITTDRSKEVQSFLMNVGSDNFGLYTNSKYYPNQTQITSISGFTKLYDDTSTVSYGSLGTKVDAALALTDEATITSYMSNGWQDSHGAYYDSENRIGAYAGYNFGVEKLIGKVKIWLGRYSAQNLALLVTLQYLDADSNWHNVKTLTVTSDLSYPVNVFEVDLNQKCYGVRWIHDQEPKKSSNNNMTFFGMTLYEPSGVGVDVYSPSTNGYIPIPDGYNGFDNLYIGGTDVSKKVDVGETDCFITEEGVLLPLEIQQSTDKIEIEFYHTRTRTYDGIIGNSNSTSTGATPLWINGNSRLQFYNYILNTYTMTTGYHKFVYDPTNASITIDGTVIASGITLTAFSHSYYALACRMTGTAYYSGGYIGKFKVTNTSSGKVRCDYRPCLRNGVSYLYDTVTDTLAGDTRLFCFDVHNDRKMTVTTKSAGGSDASITLSVYEDGSLVDSLDVLYTDVSTEDTAIEYECVKIWYSGRWYLKAIKQCVYTDSNYANKSMAPEDNIHNWTYNSSVDLTITF